jgi:hypothetical protein
VLATLSLTVLVSYGALFYAFGVVVKPMQSDLGWSRATISAAFSVGTHDPLLREAVFAAVGDVPLEMLLGVREHDAL